jgi:hypothetical protein
MMADPTNAAAPAAQPSAAPAVTPAPQARPAAPVAPGSQDVDPGLKGPANPNPVATGAAPTKKFPTSSSLITNPQPAETYEEEKHPTELELPAATIAEMEAGKAALERNKPRSLAAARAAEQTPRTEDGTPLPSKG